MDLDQLAYRELLIEVLAAVVKVPNHEAQNVDSSTHVIFVHMTVCVGIALPSGGAVMACDSRVCVGESIMTDDCQKWVITGSVISLAAGATGGLFRAIGRAKGLVDLHEAAADYTEGKSLEWCLLSYDRELGGLWYLDSDGQLLPLDGAYAVGCGADLARGVMVASKPPTSLEQAGKLARKACGAACTYSALCGGTIHVLTVPTGRRRKVVAQTFGRAAA